MKTTSQVRSQREIITCEKGKTREDKKVEKRKENKRDYLQN